MTDSLGAPRLGLVARKRGCPRRLVAWLGTDGPRQPPTVPPHKVLPVVTDNQLAAAAFPVDLGAAVAFARSISPVSVRRQRLVGIWGLVAVIQVPDRYTAVA
jgi:hypothetical protein